MIKRIAYCDNPTCSTEAPLVGAYDGIPRTFRLLRVWLPAREGRSTHFKALVCSPECAAEILRETYR